MLCQLLIIFFALKQLLQLPGSFFISICLNILPTACCAFFDLAIPKSESLAGVVSRSFGLLATSVLPLTITSARKLRVLVALSFLPENSNKLFSLSINFV